MGAVYKARDPRLNRSVAIKQVTAQRPKNFETEVRAIAALNHPHICQIYDIGPDYLVLEYLHGEPLRRPVNAGDTRRLAIQMADASLRGRQRSRSGEGTRMSGRSRRRSA
jgi:serine/threonine protein kinase